METKATTNKYMSALEAWYHCMEVQYKMQVVQKKDSALMKTIAFFLNIIHKFFSNVCSGEDFMNSFTTTLFNKIYVCYPINSLKDDNYNIDIPHIIHETQHVLQFRSSLMMPVKYLFSGYQRMLYEVEAFSNEIEYKVKTKDPENLMIFIENAVWSLKSEYGVSVASAKIARSMLLKKLEAFKKGKFDKNTISDNAIKFWNSLKVK